MHQWDEILATLYFMLSDVDKSEDKFSIQFYGHSINCTQRTRGLLISGPAVPGTYYLRPISFANLYF
jgi:hypothetical protein